MVSKMIFATRPETILIFSCGMEWKTKIVPAIIAMMIPKNPMMALLKMLIPCFSQTAITATRVAAKVVTMIGMNTSAGLAAPI